jgi:hypothetical protein
MKFRTRRAARVAKPARRKNNVFKFRRAASEMEELRAIAQCSGWGDFYQFIGAAVREYTRREEMILGVSAREAVKLDRAARLALHQRQREINMGLCKTGIFNVARN